MQILTRLAIFLECFRLPGKQLRDKRCRQSRTFDSTSEQGSRTSLSNAFQAKRGEQELRRRRKTSAVDAQIMTRRAHRYPVQMSRPGLKLPSTNAYVLSFVVAHVCEVIGASSEIHTDATEHLHAKQLTPLHAGCRYWRSSCLGRSCVTRYLCCSCSLLTGTTIIFD